MLQKYVEEKYPAWMILGEYPDGDVGVTDCNESLDVKLSPTHARAVVAQQHVLITALTKLADAFDRANPEAFKSFWYGEL